MKEQHSFRISIADLRRRVEMHTSRIGMSRNGEDGQHMLEKYSLTDGEGFLFDDYLKEAVGKTYNWIKAFGRNLTDACKVYPAGETKKLYEGHGVRITLDGEEMVAPPMGVSIHLTSSMYEVTEIPIVPAAIGKKRFGIVLHLPEIGLRIGHATRIDYRIVVRYKTIADGVFVDREEYEDVRYTTEDETISSDYAFTVDVKYREFEKEIMSVDMAELLIDHIEAPKETLKKGDYVEMLLSNLDTQYGIVEDGGRITWWDEDLRDSVIYKIELLDWMDRNMLDEARERLENALLNYILYRWFETTQDNTATLQGGRWRKAESQADKYLAKWEDDVMAAKSALNSQRRILQRKSTWLQ